MRQTRQVCGTPACLPRGSEAVIIDALDSFANAIPSGHRVVLQRRVPGVADFATVGVPSLHCEEKFFHTTDSAPRSWETHFHQESNVLYDIAEFFKFWS